MISVSKKNRIVVFAFIALLFFSMAYTPVYAANFATWFAEDSGTTSDLNSIWGADNNNVFAVGKAGTIIYFDGSTWNSIDPGVSGALNGVWGSGVSNVFAVGNSGIILHYDGSDWTSMTSGTINHLHAVWGSGSEVFAAGNSGTILYYNGSDWSTLTSGTSDDLYSLWGTNGSDVFAAGSTGAILHFDGSAWDGMSSGINSDLQCVWGVDSSDVFAVGISGRIRHFDGSGWKTLNSGTTADLYGIWGASASDVFAVGSSGTIIHYNGSGWSPMNRDTANELHAIWGFYSSEVITAGWSGTILRYLPPRISSISTDQADQGSTLSVTITGINLNKASDVSFGTGIAVNSFTVVNANQIKANITIVASASAGTRDVTVITPGGSFVLPKSFTVKEALPTITSIGPNQERQGTILDITITGTNLNGTSEVRFGEGIAVNGFTVLSSNQVAAKIAIGSDARVGPRDVSITTPVKSFTLPAGFTVRQALPEIASVSPNQGNQESTLDVTINGTNLTGAGDVQFGAGIQVNSYSILSSNQIVANVTIMAGALIGPHDVSVTTPGGSFTLPGSLIVKQALPKIASVRPDRGSQGATISVTLTGVNFSGTNEVRFGNGILVNNISVLNSNQVAADITIISGAAIDTRDVMITTPGGSFVLPKSFMVLQAPPALTTVSPAQGTKGATISVIISGSNLHGATSISFGTGVEITSFTVLSPTQVKANITIESAAITGMRDVSLTTPGGSSTLANSFNVKTKSAGILIIALIWTGIAVIIVIFAIILNRLRQKRADKL